MSTTAFVDRIDPFAKRSLKKKTKKSQGSSRYRNSQDVELQPLPLLKGKLPDLVQPPVTRSERPTPYKRGPFMLAHPDRRNALGGGGARRR
ncbi:hypothetical protein BDFB_007990 [Asbolus verrucosus]|uniref:Uncharacterized protein n=1 Tax=Asbolus verrucosus TaxID=1661398 RepID=A0A482VAD8_ASBVE|nr:hypothetical protein BDFB_007990 [Asbolus verrucosus]